MQNWFENSILSNRVQGLIPDANMLIHGLHKLIQWPIQSLCVGRPANAKISDLQGSAQ